MVKLDATRHWWITIDYSLGKSNIDADTLSRTPWDWNIETDAVGAIFKAKVDGPEALMEVCACHKRAISPLIWESPPTQMTALGLEGRPSY